MKIFRYLSILSILFLLCYINTSGQNLIKGRVIDNSKMPIAFASVYLTNSEDTTQIISGTITDFKGEFALRKNENMQVFINASCIGYEKFEKEFIPSDTTYIEISLGIVVNNIAEVVVEGKLIKNDIEKTSYMVSVNDRKNASTSLSLARVIPGLLTNEVNNKITTVSGESVKILINGINASEIDLLALSPNQVASIERYDVPPTRFANSGFAEVINIITKESVMGVNAFVSLQNTFVTGFGNDMLNVNYNKKNSQIGVYYFYSFRGFNKKVYDATFDYDINNNEYSNETIGENSLFGYKMHIINLSYITKKDQNYLFSLKVSPNYVNSYNHPRYNTHRRQDDVISDAAGMSDSKDYEFTPSIDLYFQKDFKNNSDFIVNVVGGSFKTESNYTISEISDGVDTLLSDFLNNRNNKYSLIAEIQYAKQWDKIKWSTGIIFNQGWLKQHIENSYGNGDYTLNTSNNYVYSEIQTQIKKLSIKASLGLNSSSFVEKEIGSSYNFNTLTPIINISYPISQKSSIKLHYKNKPVLPSLSDLSNHMYYENVFLVQSGNPDVKPYRSHYSFINYGFYSGKMSFETKLQYSYAKSPFLDSYVQEGDYLKFTCKNEGWKNDIVLSSYINYKMFSNKLNTTFYAAMVHSENKYNGLDKNVYRAYVYSISASYSIKNFSFTGNYSTPVKRLSNQIIKTSPTESDFYIQYKHNSISFGAGVYLPFTKSYQTEYKSVDQSLVNSYKNVQIYDNGSMLYFKLTYNLTYGKGYSWNKRTDNKDTETGTIKTGN